MTIRNTVIYASVLILLALVIALVVVFFNVLPVEGTTLGIDFRGLWRGLEGGRVNYVGTGLFISPWSVLFVLPLGLLPFRTSWALLSFATLAILIVSVPRTPRRWLFLSSVFMLVVSFLVLRQIADGNFEVLVIGGILLTIEGFRRGSPLVLALGLLAATGKLQETWLMIPAVGFYVLTTWPPRRQLVAISSVVLVVAVCWLLFGQSWFGAMMGIREKDTIVNINLLSSASRLDIPLAVAHLVLALGLAVTAAIVLFSQRTMTRDKAAMLVCASLLLAPYSAGNSFLTVLAIGIMALFQSQPRLGIALWLLTTWWYFAPTDLAFWWSSNYWTGMLVLTWGILIWKIYSEELRPSHQFQLRSNVSEGL